MPKKIVGLVVAAVLAITGQSFAMLPAAAGVPQYASPTRDPADKAKAKAAKAAKAAKEKAARAGKAKADAAARAAKARDAYIANSGPRAAAAARAAAVARTRAAAAASSAKAWRARAALLARGAAAARARAAALPKTTKAQAAAKKTADAAASKATKDAQAVAAAARRAATAAARAGSEAAARRQLADEAQAVYVALAGPRADLTARQAAAARGRAVATARAIAPARARAVATQQAGVAARARYTQASAAVAATKAKVAKKALKKLSRKQAKRAKKAARVSKRTARAAARSTRAAESAAVRAASQYRESLAVADRSRALAQQLSVAATRAREAAGPNVAWNPTDAVMFNHPRGTKKQKYALITQLNRAIDSTPAGGQIRIAMYLFDIGSVANKLIAAHRRGVSVQILLDDNTTNKWIRKVKRALGTDRKARSFFGVCDHSCMSQGTSTIHAKFYLFSVAGKARYVSLVSSGNPYSGNTTKSWNNTHTIVRNKTIYDSLNKYFTDMVPDKNDRNYYRVTQSGKYTVYYYPQVIRRSNDLVWMNHLNRVSCRAAPGFGNAKGQTLIRVANWGWTNARKDVAKRLWKLHNAGCAVQVMVNRGRIDRGILKVLLKRSKKHGKMPVYNAWRDWRKKAIAGLYVHHKFATISGPIGGRNIKLTLTGSQNFTALGTTANNDLVLRVIDPRMLEQYNANFAFIRKRYTARMKSVPLVTRVPNRKGGA